MLSLESKTHQREVGDRTSCNIMGTCLQTHGRAWELAVAMQPFIPSCLRSPSVRLARCNVVHEQL
jgi:hypothetical protein